MKNGRRQPEALVALLLGALVVFVFLALLVMGSLLGNPLGYVRDSFGFLAWSAFMGLVVVLVARLGPRYLPGLPVWRSRRWIIWALLLLSLGYQCVE